MARKIAEGGKGPYSITAKTLDQLSWPAHIYPGDRSWTACRQPGLATGLAWTEVGGEILHIEVNLMPGKGNLILTGQLGEVMKESVQAALTYCRSRSQETGVDDNYFEKIDIHVHVPAGAIPKDGPSAGITMATAIYSAVTRQKV